jgi:predicted ester cyclase
MSVQDENKKTVLRWEEEFKNKANVGITDDLMSPDFRHELPFPGLPPGREGLKAAGTGIFMSFAHETLKVTVEKCLADGDWVVTRTRVRAVHTGDFNGVPPTKKEVGWTENTVYRLKDGKIVEMIGEGNFLGVMGQLAGR